MVESDQSDSESSALQDDMALEEVGVFGLYEDGFSRRVRRLASSRIEFEWFSIPIPNAGPDISIRAEEGESDVLDGSF
jgi:hypothetical protein